MIHVSGASLLYLALHATCAKVTCLSSLGEYINIVDREINTTWVLAEDGSSVRILEEPWLGLGSPLDVGL
jgi:hypothetical protein